MFPKWGKIAKGAVLQPEPDPYSRYLNPTSLFNIPSSMYKSREEVGESLEMRDGCTLPGPVLEGRVQSC